MAAMRRALLPLLLAVAPGCDDPGTAGPATIHGGDAAADARVATPDRGVEDAEIFPDALPGCALADGDDDGYGTDPTCEFVDCDDANRSIHPGAYEACNGVDDDCDGEVDEGLNVAVCGLGECRREAPNCLEGKPNRCTPGEPAPEACNGLDDDCDGMTDEGAGADTCGVGACQRQGECQGGQPGTCTPGDPGPEACNGVDDDCDGQTDEGQRGEVVQTSYGELSQRHPPCNGSGQRLGPDCNAAINRLCAARDCMTSGFGPVENSGDVAVLGCVQTVAPAQVSFADLAARHEVCDGSRQRIGPECNAAIHRWCAAQGHVSGFGPIESGPDFVLVACVTPAVAEGVGTRYSVLVTHHPGCNGVQRIGSDCNAAIHRFCAANGFLTGYGPVENSGDDAAVVCIRR
ncbi:MAG: putative metal-binding motif-containing protein [Myxococcales bacterium]|nr:putative metal-binding motif-containing protein [Myxococcales bacterium]